MNCIGTGITGARESAGDVQVKRSRGLSRRDAEMLFRSFLGSLGAAFNPLCQNEQKEP
jgi:hypothetical protein